MQGYAAKQLVQYISPGMSYEEVSALLGARTPKSSLRDSSEEVGISYNVRAPYNNGIDVYFVSNRVSRVFYYD
jgi:uncharacterized protein YeeX (DUF496 family)